MVQPKISIIVPVYNSEKYLLNCLRALSVQTLKDIEVVCIDDGSTDKSLAILTKHAEKDKRFKVYTQKNAGPATARNEGLKKAQAPYLMFCDADDWYEPNMCECLYQKIKAGAYDVVSCYPILEIEDGGNRPIPKEHYFPPKGLSTVPIRLNCFLWSKIFKKSLIDQHHITFPDGYLHDDDAFWAMYVLVSSNVFVLDKKLYHYRIRPDSIMDHYFSHNQKDYTDRLAILQVVCQFAKDHHLLPEKEVFLFQFCQAQLKTALQFCNKAKVFSLLSVFNSFFKNIIFSVHNQKLIYTPSKKLRLEHYGYSLLNILTLKKNKAIVQKHKVLRGLFRRIKKTRKDNP